MKWPPRLWARAQRLECIACKKLKKAQDVRQAKGKVFCLDCYTRVYLEMMDAMMRPKETVEK